MKVAERGMNDSDEEFRAMVPKMRWSMSGRAMSDSLSRYFDCALYVGLHGTYTHIPWGNLYTSVLLIWLATFWLASAHHWMLRSSDARASSPLLAAQFSCLALERGSPEAKSTTPLLRLYRPFVCSARTVATRRPQPSRRFLLCYFTAPPTLSLKCKPPTTSSWQTREYRTITTESCENGRSPLPCMNVFAHATMFIWMLTISCCLV